MSSHVEHNSLIYIGRNYRDGPWHDAVGETFHVYILDRTIYNIPAIYINESLTEEDIELIPKEMIITRMTVNRDDFTKDGDRIVYPPYETDKMK